MIRDPETNLPIFASSKFKYNVEKPMQSLETNIVHVAEVVSPLNKKLEVEANKIILRGIEGTSIDGKEILVSAEQNIYLRSSNGSIVLNAHNGIFMDIDRIYKLETVIEFNQNNSNLQYKLCICYPKGALYRVQLSKLHSNVDACRHFDRRYFNPCL